MAQRPKLSPAERVAVRAALARLPEELAALLHALSASAARERRAGLAFSAVEQVWHLADLEHEGFGRRIERLLHEEQPLLADFDGDAIAAERDYRRRSLREGLLALTTARAANVALLDRLREEDWERGGIQEGVGPVTLADIPRLMSEHDAAHRGEIELWLAAGAAPAEGSG
ncbi:MAG TPA: DinB family protein [Steroidobacteraceae bacterium]|nr:DinB family protein [Steroidobacteraceae bacterium]